MSIIHQELNLVEQLSAAANIFLGRETAPRWACSTTVRWRSPRPKSCLSSWNARSRRAAQCGTLRVGDQQLIEIAKALSLETEILIMDEPTSALDRDGGRPVCIRVIERLRKRGVTILYISHKMDEVFRLADRITVLRDGRLVKTLDRGRTTAREVTHLMVGREIEAAQASCQPRTPGRNGARSPRICRCPGQDMRGAGG